jgi:hypothetical protein
MKITINNQITLTLEEYDLDLELVIRYSIVGVNLFTLHNARRDVVPHFA